MHRSTASGSGAALHEADEVALRVAEERHPLLGPGIAERALVIAEDQVRAVGDLDARRLERRHRPVDAVDLEVEGRRGGAGSINSRVLPRSKNARPGGSKRAINGRPSVSR